MRASRPRFAPGYGLADGEEGLLPWSWVEERLVAARNYWLATAGPSGPHAAPVWGLWRDTVFAFGTDPSSRKGRNLARDPRVAMHLASGDEVVIVEGVVEPLDPSLLDEFADAYEEKYAHRPPGLYALRPHRAFAWREQDFPTSATQFDASSESGEIASV
jgi:hypothetical protein